MTEAEMNEKLAKESDATVHWIEATLVAYAITQFGRTRSSIDDLLVMFTKKDGTISESRVRSLLGDIDDIGDDLRKVAESTILNTVQRTSDRQIKTVAGVLSAFGDDLNTSAIAKETLRYVRAGAFSNDIPLSSRVWGTSGVIIDNIRTQLRQGIVQGESVSSLMKRVRSVYDAEAWQIRRLVTTEANVAQRKVTGESALRSNVVKGVKITDHPGHRNHEKHRCYALAHRDPYGMGMGVYLPTDSEIYSPHPQCTSTLTYVLKDEVRRGA
ncbi:hypothetical protein [Terribacillus saccharophilus]|uniref:hypothetical protein n=1 Tax=Terribacillus saccharophilus TaxID=361277 RepID=UPI003D279370